MMAANRRKDTKPELIVRQNLHAAGFRYRLDVRGLPGSPDIVLRRYNAAVFVHGCFWHRHEGCKFAASPKSNVKFWEDKFQRNVERDRNANQELGRLGWRVAVIWECSLSNANREKTLLDFVDWLQGNPHEPSFREFPLSHLPHKPPILNADDSGQ